VAWFSGFLQWIKVFSHFFLTGCSLVSRGELAGLLNMKIIAPVSCSARGEDSFLLFPFSKPL
jgi:hypothetical protein